MNNKILGFKGEQIAKQYLIKKKYQILESNYKVDIGEIDIIAKQKDITVFVEVKTRSSNFYGYPREAVNLYKQNKIRKVALTYLKMMKNVDSKIRFDVIEILEDKVIHIENAF